MNVEKPRMKIVGIAAAAIAVVAGLIVAPFGLGSFGGDSGGVGWYADGGGQGTLVAALGASGARPGPMDTPVTAYDLDGDGVDELLTQSQDRHVYVFSVKHQKVVAKLYSRHPAGWHIDSVLNKVEAGVMEPGKAPSIVATNHAAYVIHWRYVDTGSDGMMEFEKVWEVRMDSCHRSPGMDAGPALADADGDGDLEVFVQTEEVGFYGLETNGTVMWEQCWGGGNGAPVIDDLDEDGRLEAIFASDAGFVAVVRATTGEPLWTFDAGNPRYGIKPASITVSPTVADLDGVMPKEVVFTARQAPNDDPEQFEDFHMGIFAITHDPDTWKAKLMWMRQPEWAHPMSYTQLVIEDVDGDGKADIFGADWNTIGHKPGNWENLGPAHAFRLDSEGNDVWVRSVDTWWSNKDIALGDTDGDGTPDLLVNSAQGGHDGLVRLSATNGKSQGFISAGPWKVMRGPLVGDFDHDGSTDLAYTVMPDQEDAKHGAVLLYDLEVPYAPPAATG